MGAHICSQGFKFQVLPGYTEGRFAKTKNSWWGDEMVQLVEMFACRLSHLNSIQSQAMLWPSYTQRERERQRGREGG